jgi:hypothetical protein
MEEQADSDNAVSTATIRYIAVLSRYFIISFIDGLIITKINVETQTRLPLDIYSQTQ